MLGLGGFLEQAQKIRSEMTKLQESLATRTVQADCAGVKVVATGKQKILSITIDPEVLKEGQREKLEARIQEAVNQALQASQTMVSEEMSRMGGSLGPLSSLLKGMS